MADALRYALGWLCFQLVMLLPVCIGNPAWMWACGWAGYYANHPSHTAGPDSSHGGGNG